MENKESSTIQSISSLHLSILLVVVLFLAFSYYQFLSHTSQKHIIPEFSIVGNNMIFKMDGYDPEFIIEFNETPIIQKNDKVLVEANKNPSYVQVYINDKLVYDKFSDLTFTMSTGSKEEGTFSSKVIKNIKEDQKIPATSI